MSPEILEHFDSIVEAAARALFGTHDMPLGEQERDFGVTPGDHDVAGTIGFTSPELRGAVLLTARRDVLARAWPAELRRPASPPRTTCATGRVSSSTSSSVASRTRSCLTG